MGSWLRRFMRPASAEWIGTLTPEDAEEAIQEVYGCPHGLTLHDGPIEDGYTETYVGTTSCILLAGHEGRCRPPYEFDGYRVERS